MKEASVSYTSGYRVGKSDFLLGLQSSHAWNGIFDASVTLQEYSQGYRHGWLDARDEYRSKAR